MSPEDLLIFFFASTFLLVCVMLSVLNTEAKRRSQSTQWQKTTDSFTLLLILYLIVSPGQNLGDEILFMSWSGILPTRLIPKGPR
jgi:hypothetical protein